MNQSEQPAAPARRAETTDLAAALDGSWGELGRIAASAVTFVLLFQPWLTASGGDGQASVDAFGHIKATTAHLNAWSTKPPRSVQFTGSWALLACVAIGVTVLVACYNMRARSEALTWITSTATVCLSWIVFFTLLYLSSKGPELKATLGVSRDLGAQLGLVMRWALGKGQYVLPGSRVSAYESAGLTPWALLAGMVSLGSAVSAVVEMVIRNRRRDH